MISTWLYALGSVFVVSLIAFVGILTLSIRKKTLHKILLYLVSFSAGALFGGAFIHLLPEAVEKFGFNLTTSLSLTSGIIVFFVLEKFIHWRHCHIPTSEEHPHPFAYMNLVGDGVHNFIDGLVIGGAYLLSIPVGIATTIAVILHEIPQEIGDFGVLIYGGFSTKKALLMNFATALTAIAGAVTALIISGYVENLAMYLIPFAAGGFIYIAGSDLIPELHKECAPKKSAIQFICLLLGIAVMMSVLLLHHA